MPIGRIDIKDSAVVDAVELLSDGTTQIFTGVTVVSTTSSTKRVVLSNIYIIHGDIDEILEAGDLVTLSGTSGGAADGNYTIADIIDDTTFEVVESIADSTGGACEAKYPPGARRVGFDSTGLINITADNVQDALEEIDVASVNPSQHKALRQLIHFIETNSPGDGFGSGPYQSELLPSADPFPTSETWYETSSKLLKICRWEATYNANKTYATEKWIVYKTDGTNPAADATDTISYSGVFETGRSRAIAVY